MKQLNVSIEDKLFNKWKTIASEKNVELVSLVRSMLQGFAPDKESIVITCKDVVIKGEAEISFFQGKNSFEFWFGTIYLHEQMLQVRKWLENIEKEWVLSRQNEQSGHIKIFHIGIRNNGSDCEVVLGFSGVSKLS